MQTLKGSGTVVGAVVAAAGSCIAPGDSAGTLTLTGDLTLNDGALLDFELGAVEGSDKISMASSTLYLGNQEYGDFMYTALSGFGAGEYVLIDAGVISGSLGTNLSGAVGGLPATLKVSGNDLVLNVVPEPGVWVLLGMGFLMGAIGRRKKGRRMRDEEERTKGGIRRIIHKGHGEKSSAEDAGRVEKLTNG
jgi:hypothetical protein